MNKKCPFLQCSKEFTIRIHSKRTPIVVKLTRTLLDFPLNLEYPFVFLMQNLRFERTVILDSSVLKQRLQDGLVARYLKIDKWHVSTIEHPVFPFANELDADLWDGSVGVAVRRIARRQ